VRLMTVTLSLSRSATSLSVLQASQHFKFIKSHSQHCE
jgi:hypothetical protein